jgi:N-acetylmuramoyl-L-alanine amidase
MIVPRRRTAPARYSHRMSTRLARAVDRPLSYVARLAPRALEAVDLVVIHCTELPDLATAREYGERVRYPDSATGASGHWYVDRDGSLQRWVPEERIAHHTRGYNERSIGIELVNLGRYPDWYHSDRQLMTEPYPEAQIAALLELLAHLRARLPQTHSIAGHEDLDLGLVGASDDPRREVRRKLDPGPLFPWPRVLAKSKLDRLHL